MSIAPEFEHLGYFKEYYIGTKLIGKIKCDKDRELTGYAGRVFEEVIEVITLDNGKKIKPGTEVMTMIYPLCGKVINR